MGAYSVVGLDEGVVDGNDVDFVMLDAAGHVSSCKLSAPIIGKRIRVAEDNSSNATEAVDSCLDEALAAVRARGWDRRSP